MKHQIIAAGKPALGYAKTGVAEYLKRLSRYGSYEPNTSRTAAVKMYLSAFISQARTPCVSFSMNVEKN